MVVGIWWYGGDILLWSWCWLGVALGWCTGGDCGIGVCLCWGVGWMWSSAPNEGMRRCWLDVVVRWCRCGDCGGSGCLCCDVVCL